MRKRSTVLGTMRLIVAGLALSVAAWGADTQIGTWKLNVAKSKYNPGPAPKSATLRIEPQGDGIKVTLDSIDAEGKPVQFELTGKYDGKDYPVMGWDVSDTVTLKRVDANTVETVMKKAGKVVTTTRSVVSQDGKTRTSTQTGKNAQGKDVSNTLVYDKQ